MEYNKLSIWRWGLVTSNDDPFNAGRIKVRLFPEDNDVDPTEENSNVTGLPWSEPLLPKYLNFIPEPNTLVRVTTYNIRNEYVKRLYIGPAISQQTPKDLLTPDYFLSRMGIDFGSPNSVISDEAIESNVYVKNWELNPESKDLDWKVYPNKSDIAFLGKKNADIIIRGNNQTFFDEIQLRAGKINPNSLSTTQPTLNQSNPAYITINFTDSSAFKQEGIGDTYKFLNLQKDRSHINLVADKINLISHEGSNTPKILQGKKIIQQIDTENKYLHPVVYGDVLWEFLEILKKFIIGHTHPYSNLPPDPSGPTLEIVNWFNNNMGFASSKPISDGTDSYVEIENCTFLSKGVKTN